MAVLERLATALPPAGAPVRLCLIGFEPVFIERLGRLHLYRPPAENLVAAKLIRADPKDLGDISFLISRHRPDGRRVRQIVAGFERPAREKASENLVYLDVLET